MIRRFSLGLTAVAFAAGAWLGPASDPASAGTLVMKSCSAFGDPAAATDVDGPVWQAQAQSSGLSLANRCPQGGSLQITPTNPIPAGASAQWHTITPPSIGITGALTPLNQVLVQPGTNTQVQGFSASYFWSGGSQTIADEGKATGGMDYGLGIDRNDLGGSRYFGFQTTCIASKGCRGFTNGSQQLDVKGIELTAQDNTPPSMVALGAGNLWYQTPRWVRGLWPASFQASDDSGICGMRMLVDGQSISGPAATPNQSSWTQCPTPQTMSQSIDTTGYPNGPMSLLLSAADAASPANVSSPSETLQVDNTPVSVALTGPTDAPSTAGTQYVTASASAGPSGVAGIDCSVDGSPDASYPGASAQVPVSGIGQHTVSCDAQNNSYNASLQPATSPSEGWHLSIRQPTVSQISFGTRLLNALRCHPVIVPVRVPAQWVTIHRHGKRVRRHRRARTVKRREVRCHPRVVIRKVRRRGHVYRKRIVLLPRTVQLTHKRVAYGHTANVEGFVALADGTALAGVPVRVITATDNGQQHWRTATVVSTSANGFWDAKIRPGPSRLIAAVYPGSGTTEPATSGQAKLIVGTKVSLHVHPRVVRWGHTIQISGRVLGGNIPTGKLLRLRIGAAGLSSTVGIPNINREGRYHATWSFGAGRGVVRYWFSVSTLPEADYPYAQTSSRRVYVTVHD